MDQNVSSSDLLKMIQPQQSKFIEIQEDPTSMRVEVHIRGDFISPDECSSELTALHQLSEQYPHAVLHINSGGGLVSTLHEMIAIFSRFQYLTTINVSSACSAAFTLWCIGDIRVAGVFAEFMAHRESYIFGGKTGDHLDYAQHNQKVYTEMMNEYCGDVLSEFEIEQTQRSEVWLSGQDLIERRVAVSWEDYVNGESRGSKPIVTVGDVSFVPVDETGDVFTPVEITPIDKSVCFNLSDLLYFNDEEMSEIITSIRSIKDEENVKNVVDNETEKPDNKQQVNEFNPSEVNIDAESGEKADSSGSREHGCGSCGGGCSCRSS